MLADPSRDDGFALCYLIYRLDEVVWLNQGAVTVVVKSVGFLEFI